MKSIQGLLVAVGLALVAAVFNWMYLNSGPSREATVFFVGIKKGETVRAGEALRDEHLVQVPIPEVWAGDLRDFAFEWKDRPTVVGSPVVRTITGGYLLLNDDLHTPPQKIKFEPGDSVIFVPVDTRAFVPSLLEPGDKVSFMVARSSVPTLAMPSPPPGGLTKVMPSADGSGASSSGPIEIGPFTILALGNRLCSTEVMRASKGPQQVQENVLTIRVPAEGVEAKNAEILSSLLQATNFREVGVKLHSRNKAKP
jgi:hypothetical protein